MFSRHLSWVAAVAVAFCCHPPATAQFYGSGCSSCGTAAPVAQAVSSCTPIQPVYSSCYQTVPVTTYRKERQTVKVPYYRTVSEEREVTEYRPVTRTRTVKVPTVSYKTVYENKTVQKDLGRWQTNYQPVAKRAPCQVDPRPGLLGWLNRTGYSFQSAFVPNYRTTRQYVPNRMACNVQVPRQVAVRGEREVEQRWTEMVPRTRTVKVDVQKLAWKEKEVTVNRPMTAYRTVPVGSALAYGYGSYGYPGSSVAFLDEGDEDAPRTARKPEPDPSFDEVDGDERPRSARGTWPEDGPARRSSDATERNAFQRTSGSRTIPDDGRPLKPAKPVFPDDSSSQSHEPDKPSFEDFQSRRSNRRSAAPAFAGGWRSSKRTSDVQTAGKGQSNPGFSLTDAN